MKPRKKAGDAAPLRDGPTFEQAIQRLETIVADMENAALPLEDILQKYEEGTRLVQFCSQKLEEAEQKIELLTKKANGSVTLEPFATDEPPAPAAEDDAKLF